METIYNEIYGAHLPYINIGKIETPTLIVFSAIPGSGKSALTKRLAEQHGFTRFANKDIRHSMNQTRHEADVAIGDYTLWLLDKLVKPSPRAIVSDRNIDQWHMPIMDWASIYRYKLVVVRIEVSYANLQKRLQKREGANAEKVLAVLDFYKNQHIQVAHDFNADLLLEEDFDLDAATRDIVNIAMRK